MVLERSTRIGSRPQAILHPHGNRGADLIEAVRLERESAALQKRNPKLEPDTRLFIQPHHTDPRAAKGSNKPGVGGPGARPWAEKRWNRPASAGVLSVHNADGLQDMLAPASAPPTAVGGPRGGGGDGDGTSNERSHSRLASPLPLSPPSPATPAHQPGLVASFGGSATSLNMSFKGGQAKAGGARPQSAHLLAEQRVRERLQQQHAATHERVMRKLRESQQAAAAKSEAEFQRAWEQFHAERNGPVAEIENMLKLKEIEAFRKANATCKQWNAEVYDIIQDQVEAGMRQREASGAYNTRWRLAQDDYLRTIKKKEMGIFRDIVIEEEYDPLETAKDVIKYSSRTVNLRDPLKTEIRKAHMEAQMVPGSRASALAAKAKQRESRDTLDVKLWSKIDGTPYGHFSKMMNKPITFTRGEPLSSSGARVMGNHYDTRPVTPEPFVR